jgi:ribose transport system substrate-binding protein
MGLIVAILLFLLTGFGCAATNTLVFGVVCRSAKDSKDRVIRAGVEDEAAKLGKEMGIEVKIDWRMPNESEVEYSSAQQVREIGDLVGKGSVGIGLIPVDIGALTRAIQDATNHNVEVVIIGGEAPQTKRVAGIGINDRDRGRKVMEALAQEIGNKGLVAILAGDPAFVFLRERVEGVQEEAKKYADIKIQGIYYCRLDPESAAGVVMGTWQAHPDITAWGMVAGWTLFTQPGAIKWPPGSITVVAYDDFMDSELSYVQSGYIRVLLVDDFYQWGVKTVDVLYNSVNGQGPEYPFTKVDPIRVTRENAEEFAEKWHRWIRE